MARRTYVSMSAVYRGEVIHRDRQPRTVADLPPGGIYCIGPFRTVEAAQICASGAHCPHFNHVNDYEREARRRRVDRSIERILGRGYVRPSLATQ